MIVSEVDLLNETMKFWAAMPLDIAHNIALCTLFARAGLRFRQTSLLGLNPPELLPPYKVFYCPATQTFCIRQGEEGAAS